MRIRDFIRTHPIGGFYAMVQAIAYGCFLIVVGPKLLQGGAMKAGDAFVMFPVIVTGVALAGVGCTWATGGRVGLHDLRLRLTRWRVGVRWYLLALLVAPAAILAVLLTLEIFYSASFRPGFFPLGVVFGFVPGFVEEIGWTGYLVERLGQNRNAIWSAVALGLLWGFWHLPVSDFLGAAAPHGRYWIPFFFAFVAAMTAMRVLMVWIYLRTRSGF